LLNQATSCPFTVVLSLPCNSQARRTHQPASQHRSPLPTHTRSRADITTINPDITNWCQRQHIHYKLVASVWDTTPTHYISSSITNQISTLPNKAIRFHLTLDYTNIEGHYFISSVMSINIQNFGVQWATSFERFKSQKKTFPVPSGNMVS